MTLRVVEDLDVVAVREPVLFVGGDGAFERLRGATQLLVALQPRIPLRVDLNLDRLLVACESGEDLLVVLGLGVVFRETNPLENQEATFPEDGETHSPEDAETNSCQDAATNSRQDAET